MIALLRRLFTSSRRPSPRANGGRPSALLSLERLEDRVTPATVTAPAFIGLTVADSHLNLFPPNPIAPALVQSPVFALNYQVPPSPCTPLNALIGAFGQTPPTPIHSPVFVGVEAFLSGGGATGT